MNAIRCLLFATARSPHITDAKTRRFMSCGRTGNRSAKATLVGAAALSPVTDLTLSGGTNETRADADPLFTRPQVAELVRSSVRERLPAVLPVVRGRPCPRDSS